MRSGATLSKSGEAETVPPSILLAFAPIHKVGLGVACGLVSGLLLFLATAVLILRGGPVVGPNLLLLSNYFPGFSVDWPGAAIGFLWAAAAGFVVGWLVAFLRNLLLALYLLLIKARSEMAQYGDFLDHI